MCCRFHDEAVRSYRQGKCHRCFDENWCIPRGIYARKGCQKNRWHVVKEEVLVEKLGLDTEPVEAEIELDDGLDG